MPVNGFKTIDMFALAIPTFFNQYARDGTSRVPAYEYATQLEHAPKVAPQTSQSNSQCGRACGHSNTQILTRVCSKLRE